MAASVAQPSAPGGACGAAVHSTYARLAVDDPNAGHTMHAALDDGRPTTQRPLDDRAAKGTGER
eukprot:gene42923-30566_t